MFPRFTPNEDLPLPYDTEANSLPIIPAVYLPSSTNYLDTGIIVNNYLNFSFFCNINPTQANYAIWSIGGNFSLIVISNILSIRRRVTSGIFDTVSTGLTIVQSVTTLVRVELALGKLTIKINDGIEVNIAFNYPIQSGNFVLGQLSFTGAISNVGYFVGLIEPFLNINSAVFASTFSSYLATKNQLCYFTKKDLQSNFTTFIKTAIYNNLTECYEVTRDSLGVQCQKPLSLSFTVDLVFSVSELTSSLELFSHWVSPKLSFAVIKVLDTLRFVYFNGSISLQTILQLDITYLNTKNLLRVKFKNGSVNVWLNGQLLVTNLILGVSLSTHKYFFNSSKYLNPTGQYKLHSFTITENIDNITASYPDTTPIKSTEKANEFYPVRYRNQLPQNSGVTPSNTFTVTGTTTVGVNTATILTITQTKRVSYAQNYLLYVIFPVNSDWVVGDVTLSNTSATIAADALTDTFTLNVANFSAQPSRTPFQLLVVGDNYRVTLIMTLSGFVVYELPASNALVDAYFANDSLVSGVVPNLTATKNATTSAALITTDIYGKAYNISTSSQKLILQAQLTGIKTVLFIYRELMLTPNRKYVGSQTSYTFNGGTNGELVGSLAFDIGDFVKVSTVSGRIAYIAISANNLNVAYLDDALNTIKVATKISGVWSFISSITLPFNVANAANLPNAALSINNDGTVISVGLKNANSGRGTVFSFTRTSSSNWVSSLTLNSPIPAPYTGGFGISTAINNADTILLAAEQGASKIYVFNRTSAAYLTTPTQIITSYSKKIVGSNDLSRFVSIDNAGNAYVYDFGTTYTLTATIPADIDITLSGNYLAVSKFDNTVQIWQFSTGSWSNIKTFAIRGYSISMNTNGDILIGDPTDNKAYLYLQSDVWVTPKIFTGSNQYGYAVKLTTQSLAISDYSGAMDFFSSDGSSLPQTVNVVTQNNTLVPVTTIIDNTDVAVLSFESDVNLTIDSIASNVNGLWLGCLLYNRVLSVNEKTDIVNNIYKYLFLKGRSLFI